MAIFIYILTIILYFFLGYMVGRAKGLRILLSIKKDIVTIVDIALETLTELKLKVFENEHLTIKLEEAEKELQELKKTKTNDQTTG